MNSYYAPQNSHYGYPNVHYAPAPQPQYAPMPVAAAQNSGSGMKIGGRRAGPAGHRHRRLRGRCSA